MHHIFIIKSSTYHFFESRLSLLLKITLDLCLQYNLIFLYSPSILKFQDNPKHKRITSQGLQASLLKCKCNLFNRLRRLFEALSIHEAVGVRSHVTPIGALYSKDCSDTRVIQRWVGIKKQCGTTCAHTWPNSLMYATTSLLSTRLNLSYSIRRHMKR